MPSQADAVARPRIIMAETEVERLSTLATQMQQAAPLAADMLLAEIDRAEIRADNDMPGDVVRMRSTVRFEDDANGLARSVLLVYPKEADIEAGKISVLSLVGAGLIGLAVGQSIRWPDRDGHERLLRILKVEPPGCLVF
ncbi:nucleoside diphosphate kinase regulator [Caulobacter sp. RHG1]|uniref:nucleoside diphosphate kinase regulator n=1 Tax=Caulobacter sp. (strain RHG1) TaxID=2545762 RepID=UPI0015527A29|nr:nucleoside diphosphate kinase regulator [Caulobacter sp. RHG1]NQE62761.1 Regulator of nucleoside diphosphate kinase [Caulobacter sp. RHG1]